MLKRLLPALLPTVAQAHDGAHWTLDPWVVAPLLACLALYGAGLAWLWRRAGVSRGISPGRAAAWLCGWLALAAALVAPLHWLGERLFTAHMIEHEVIMTVAAPLLVAGRPLAVAAWALPAGWPGAFAALRRPWRWLTGPLVSALLHATAIWAWHWPPLFEASVSGGWAHRLQHLSFLLTALLYWWSIFWRCQPAVAAASLFVTMLHTTLLGALLTFAPRVLYPMQTAQSGSWGLSALEDQQLAGAVMWGPGGAIYALVALGFLGRALRRLPA